MSWSRDELCILRLQHLSERPNTDDNVWSNTWTATEIASALFLGPVAPSSIHHIKLVLMSKWPTNDHLLLEGSQILIDLITWEQVTEAFGTKFFLYKKTRKCFMGSVQIHVSFVIKYLCAKDFNNIDPFDNYRYFFLL